MAPCRGLGALTVGIALTVGCVSVARAQDDPIPYRLDEGAEAPPGRESGRVDAQHDFEPEDGALLLPRAILFVPKILLTALFIPTVEGIALAERLAALAADEPLCEWGAASHFGMHPVVAFRSGEGLAGGLTLGLTLLYDDAFGHGETLRASARFLGRYVHAYDAWFGADRFLGSHVWVEVDGRYESNPGLHFRGIGLPDEQLPATAPPIDPRGVGAETFFSRERFEATLVLGAASGARGSRVRVGGSATASSTTFGSTYLDERSIESVYDTARLPGFGERVSTLELGTRVSFDGRDAAGLDGVGTRLDAFAGYVPRVDGFEYAHFAVDARSTLAVFHRNRTLTLRARIEAVIGKRARIPFDSLVHLGGVDRLRGYVEGRFRDRLGVLASLEYRYPIHQNVRGVLFFDTGTVASRAEELFDTEDDLRFGGGVGLLLGSTDGVATRLDLSYGGDGVQFFVTTDVSEGFDGRDPIR